MPQNIRLYTLEKLANENQKIIIRSQDGIEIGIEPTPEGTRLYLYLGGKIVQRDLHYLVVPSEKAKTIQIRKIFCDGHLIHYSAGPTTVQTGDEVLYLNTHNQTGICGLRTVISAETYYDKKIDRPKEWYTIESVLAYKDNYFTIISKEKI